MKKFAKVVPKELKGVFSYLPEKTHPGRIYTIDYEKIRKEYAMRNVIYKPIIPNINNPKRKIYDNI